MLWRVDLAGRRRKCRGDDEEVMEREVVGEDDKYEGVACKKLYKKDTNKKMTKIRQQTNRSWKEVEINRWRWGK